MPVLVAMSGRIVPRPIEQFERTRVAAARTRHAIEAWDRLDVVIEHVRPGIEDRPEGRLDALEIWNQHFDPAARHTLARQPNRLGEDERAAVGEIVPIDRRDDRVLEAHPRNGFGDTRRFGGVELVRLAVCDGAVGAGPRADVAENHERRRAVVPALADVGATCVFADGVEAEVLHDPLEPDVVLRPGGANFQPGRFGLSWTDKLQGRFDGHAPPSLPDPRSNLSHEASLSH